MVKYILLLLLFPSLLFSQIERVWLTHSKHTPDTVCVSFESTVAGTSCVIYGLTSILGDSVYTSISDTIHHLEIPVVADTTYYYRVRVESQFGDTNTFNSYPTDTLRVVCVGDLYNLKFNWITQKEQVFDTLLAENPNLLITAGDNIKSLHKYSFAELIDSGAVLFETVPTLFGVGNHDKETSETYYDTTATMFRRYFALPDSEWVYYFDYTGFNLRLLFMDTEHISDYGTEHQACHDFSDGSVQHTFISNHLDTTKEFSILVQNERNQTMRGQTHWLPIFEKCIICFSGYCGFYERAWANGNLYFNTHIDNGTYYSDNKQVKMCEDAHYILMTFIGDELIFEAKRFDRTMIERLKLQKNYRNGEKIIYPLN